MRRKIASSCIPQIVKIPDNFKREIEVAPHLSVNNDFLECTFMPKILSKIFFFQLTYAYFVMLEGDFIHARNTKVKHRRRRYIEQVRAINCTVRAGESATLHESVTGKQCTLYAFFYATKSS